MIPNVGHFPRVGSRVLVAWNDRREASRATFDALPFLQAARDVRMLWVNPEAEMDDKGDVPCADIAASLARHGVKCTTAQSRGSDLGVADELLNRAADYGSDLLVMGAYGHRRFREFVFGSATRCILQHMTVPVLMSH